MSVLTQIFETPQIRYDFFDGVEFGTDDFGKATLRAALQFVKDSYLHTLAFAQEIAMEEGGDGELILDAFKIAAQMHFTQVMDENKLAAHIAESAESIMDRLHDVVISELNKTNMILWTQDEDQIVLNLNTVDEMLNAA